jgi:hypothetical protein
VSDRQNSPPSPGKVSILAVIPVFIKKFITHQGDISTMHSNGYIDSWFPAVWRSSFLKSKVTFSISSDDSRCILTGAQIFRSNGGHKFCWILARSIFLGLALTYTFFRGQNMKISRNAIGSLPLKKWILLSAWSLLNWRGSDQQPFKASRFSSGGNYPVTEDPVSSVFKWNAVVDVADRKISSMSLRGPGWGTQVNDDFPNVQFRPSIESISIWKSISNPARFYSEALLAHSNALWA